MGSACAAGAVEPSHVLIAMGHSADAARSSLRVSLGYSTTLEDVEQAWRLSCACGAELRSGLAGSGGGETMSARVIVAMSGGVDSSVAAAMLAEHGYDVVGIAMRLASEAAPSRSATRAACCSYEDFEDARRVAERMDFPFYVIDLRQEFATSVITPFVGEYLEGRTPNPCLLCNRDIKFDRLWQRADALGADYVATGHYARIERDAGGSFHLFRAVDARKDQSYFLFTLSQAQLSRTLFPLGSMTKDEVRTRARRWVWSTPTSRKARKSASFRTMITPPSWRRAAARRKSVRAR